MTRLHRTALFGAAAVAALMLATSTLRAEPTRAVIVYTGYDSTTRTVERFVNGGSELQSLEDLDAFTVFRAMRKQFDRDDGAGQLEIANLARDAGFFEHARRHYRTAQRADASLSASVTAEIVELDRQAAKHYMKLADKALKRRNPAEARRMMTRIVEDHPGATLVAEAKQALAQLDARMQARFADFGSRRDARRATEYLRDAEKYGQSLFENNRRGLEEGSGSQAIRLWKNAIRDGDKALDSLNKLKQEHSEKNTSSTVSRRIELVTRELVRTRLNLASQYTTRQSYNRALAEVNRALALDPDNEQALAARARIEESVGDGGIIVW